jgi:HKD family nuclease
VKRRAAAASPRPDGYNVGFNSGAAAGQTVEHLHVHVIPRYRGDVDDPRGGVRWVIPGRANYLADAGEAASNRDLDHDWIVREKFGRADRPPIELLSGGDRRMLDEVLRRLGDRSFDRVDLIVSFIMRSGLELVAPALEAALERGVAVRILTTDYLNITDAQALLRLADLCEAIPGRLAVRVFHDDATSFHPKGYLFWSSSGGAAVAVVGSSNLSRSALDQGEWVESSLERCILRYSAHLAN